MHAVKEKHPYVRADTLEPMLYKDFLTKKQCFRIRRRHILTIIVVDTSLHSLKLD